MKEIESSLVANKPESKFWLVETKSGDPHPDTGIPPSFVVVKCEKAPNASAQLFVDMGRPTKLNCSIPASKHIEYIYNKVIYFSHFLIIKIKNPGNVINCTYHYLRLSNSLAKKYKKVVSCDRSEAALPTPERWTISRTKSQARFRHRQKRAWKEKAEYLIRPI